MTECYGPLFPKDSEFVQKKINCCVGTNLAATSDICYCYNIVIFQWKIQLLFDIESEYEEKVGWHYYRLPTLAKMPKCVRTYSTYVLELEPNE